MGKNKIENKIEEEVNKLDMDRDKLKAVKKIGIFKWIQVAKSLCPSCFKKVNQYRFQGKVIPENEICALCKRRAEIILSR